MSSTLAELVVAELTQPGEIELKVVDLIKGENFDPEFIKLNPNATLPTLEVDGQVYTSTFEVVQYLIKRSGKDIKPGHKELLDKIHEERLNVLNPNFALLLSRSEEERKAKAQGIPGAFLSGSTSPSTPPPPPFPPNPSLSQQDKQPSKKYSQSPSGSPLLKDFYEPRLTTNASLLAFYQDTLPPPTSKQDFFSKSTAHFNAIGDFIHDELPQYLPSGGLLLLGGTEPSEDDYHLGAWIVRIAATNGAKTGEEGVRAYGREVPGEVVEYWRAWARRESFKRVYAEGLH
ncbi:hypothetical protein AAF712_015164 [Marasmius tenuissimus]|uniref:GST N-terminal domain-containing protein n=1 Tax=Marasmius tenuissimus TaxID=585030 RepID=A0ABR2Z920_9AGAR